MSNATRNALPRGYLAVTVANVGQRRKKTEPVERLMPEMLSIRTGLVLLQEREEQNRFVLPVACM